MNEQAVPQPEPRIQSRLAQLKVTADALRQAVLDGYTEAAACTANDPLVFPLWIRYARGTARLRELLTDEGWRRHERNGYETTLRVDGAVAIVLASGNAWTGSDNMRKQPSTRNPKGAMTLDAILTNTGQRTAEMMFDGFDEPDYPNARTYLLLHYFDPSRKEIRLELSLPVGITNGWIDLWGERLVIPSIPFDVGRTDVYGPSDEPPGGPDDEYDASVEWKPESPD